MISYIYKGLKRQPIKPKTKQRIYVYPYLAGSESALAIAHELGGKCIRRKNSTYKPKDSDVIINWGATALPFSVDFNQPGAVALASDKLRTFIALDGQVSIPRFTDDIEEVGRWRRIVCRDRHGTGGHGIDIVRRGDYLPDAELYVQYIPKSEEYRVHVMRGRAFHIQKKVLPFDHEGERDFQVRSYDNGFLFTSRDLDVPEMVVEESVKAVKVLGLDFGAVDTIWNDSLGMAYVLEVNSAPGIEGKTIKRYAEAFSEQL